MLNKNKIGFGVLLARANARPQMVVMIPQVRICAPPSMRTVLMSVILLLTQDEELNEFGMQVTAPGIHLCQLPFADDIRPLNIEVRASIVPKTAREPLSRRLSALFVASLPAQMTDDA